MFKAVHDVLAVSCTGAGCSEYVRVYIYNVGYIVELQYWGNFIVGVKAKGGGKGHLNCTRLCEKSHIDMHWTKVRM